MMAMGSVTSRRGLLTGAGQAAVAIMLFRPGYAAEILPKMVVTYDPGCGCCGAWIAHIKAAGFPVEVVELSELAPLKTRLGVPEALTSCHTGLVEAYVIEGHVPAEAIKRLLAERPQATGLAVANMPVGSPGMEVAGAEPEDYDVVLFAPGGQRVFARYRGAQEI